MSTFTKTLTYTPPSLPATDTLVLAPLLANGTSPGAFVSGDPPVWGPSSDPAVITKGAVAPDGTRQDITLLKAGSSEIDVVCDGITTQLTLRVNPTFFEMEVHTSNPTFCSEGPLQQV